MTETPNFENQKIIFWYGLRRSGNHGMQDFIFKLPNENVVHMNNQRLNYETFIKYSKIEPTNKLEDSYTGFKNIPYVLLSMENISLDNSELLEINKFNNFNNITKIIILRNPFNNLSSTWKITKNNIEQLLEAKHLWIQYANFILQNNNANDFMFILYDKFYNDIEYRNTIINEINLKFAYDDSLLNIKRNYAHSSFEQTTVTNEFNRYILFENDDFFSKEVLNNIELIELWNKICIKFNFTPLKI
jgi:hypothetical protein